MNVRPRSWRRPGLYSRSLFAISLSRSATEEAAAAASRVRHRMHRRTGGRGEQTDGRTDERSKRSLARASFASQHACELNMLSVAASV